MQPAKGLSLLIEALYVIFFISFACTLRAVSSISIGLLLLVGIVKNRLDTGSFFDPRIKSLFFYGCLVLYLVHFAAMFLTNNKNESWLNIQGKAGLALVPLAIFYTAGTVNATKKRLLLYYVLIIAAVSVYCLCFAVKNYLETGDFSYFFYHSLVQPVKGHAIYFSVLVFIALLFLTASGEKDSLSLKKILRTSLIIFLSVFLFFLSSKLVIGAYFIYLIFYLIRLIKRRSVKRSLLVVSSLLFITSATILLTTSNPVSRRFTEIISGPLEVIKMEKFDPGMYFNGIQFRLLQWRFTAEILNENNGWLTGVGPGNAQHMLDQKYISKNMYIGDPARGDHGFLEGYNTHNQFLETVLQTGIFGLIILLLTCIALIRMAWQKKDSQLSFIVVLLLAWLLTESVLERQYGIITFTFFPLFLDPGEK